MRWEAPAGEVKRFYTEETEKNGEKSEKDRGDLPQRRRGRRESKRDSLLVRDRRETKAPDSLRKSTQGRQDDDAGCVIGDGLASFGPTACAEESSRRDAEATRAKAEEEFIARSRGRRIRRRLRRRRCAAGGRGAWLRRSRERFLDRIGWRRSARVRRRPLRDCALFCKCART